MSDRTETPATEIGRPGRTRRTRRRIIVPLALVAVIGGSGALAATRPWEHLASAPAHSPVGHETVEVRKGSLSSGIQVGGALAYDAPTAVVPSGSGTLTALPAVGTVVKPGATLYEVDGKPVVLLRGDRPMWRDLGPDTGDGPDVEQLERNLIDLGYANGLGLKADRKFTADTATAVKRWQKALGVQQTGTVTLGSVVMLPQQTARVQQLDAKLGSAVGSTAVMTVTGTDLVATVQPADNQTSRFKPDGRVTVKLADGSTVGGRIRSLIRGGTGGGNGNGPGGEGGGGPEKTTVTIALDSQQQPQQAGPSTVTVTVVGETAEDALIVPVTALIALDGGGYGVKVADGATTRLVQVRLGLVADAKAQITGDVRAGDRVVVPA
ncbi:peptidoglycan-binding domain-containing protein [Kitasatospora griseola]|uniref:peptidoglycan-binding domain-containing protein n=1 Tax=Kitasatospora griseola TaxID=2064 RepID=UPI0019B90049|nr:peptidoglycan-binding domain-containing protein [Kitasatospora griseola]GGR07709.1 peptidoglycan-binding protein [Kitasatospora griseola]